MDAIHFEWGFQNYPDPSRLPYRQDGFTLSVNETTHRFPYTLQTDFANLMGEYGITRMEVYESSVFVHWDPDYPGADYDEAVTLMTGIASEYVEKREINESCESPS